MLTIYEIAWEILSLLDAITELEQSSKGTFSKRLTFTALSIRGFNKWKSQDYSGNSLSFKLLFPNWARGIFELTTKVWFGSLER